MGEVKNLVSSEAVEKLKKLAEDANICMFITNLSQTPLAARPMATQEVDEEGNIWFLSKDETDKNTDILKDSRVQLIYATNSNFEYLSVYGEAEISRDQERIDKYWSKINETWFKEGKEDPSITLIKVQPHDVYYWDTKNNKLVSLIKLVAGVVTGKHDDNGVEGKLKV